MELVAGDRFQKFGVRVKEVHVRTTVETHSIYF